MPFDERLIEIETRLAYQELTIGELSDLIHRQKLELNALRNALAQASADLRSMRDGFSSNTHPEPPPPHY